MLVGILVCKQQKSTWANLIRKEFIIKILGSSESIRVTYSYSLLEGEKTRQQGVRSQGKQLVKNMAKVCLQI